jgi:ketosteroid isomerase-like protein
MLTFRETLDRHLNAIQQRDLAAFVDTLTTEDAISLLLLNGMCIGERVAVIDFMREWFADLDWRIHFDLIRTIETSEMGMAFLLVTYDDVEQAGRPYQMKYYLSLVFTRQGERWGLVHDQNTLLRKPDPNESEPQEGSQS